MGLSFGPSPIQPEIVLNPRNSRRAIVGNRLDLYAAPPIPHTLHFSL